MSLWTIEKIKAANSEAGRYFFQPEAMRFFKSRVLSTVFEGPGGIYFITSEQFKEEPRAYTVRVFNPKTGGMESVSGHFQGCPTARKAHALAAKLAKGEAE